MDNNPFTNFDEILNSLDEPLTHIQSINNLDFHSQMNFDDLLKFTQGYGKINSVISKLDFLNSTEKNLKNYPMKGHQ